MRRVVLARAVRALALGALLPLAGCSNIEDTAAPPSELPDYETGVALETGWRNDTGDAFNRRWVRMAPWTDDDAVYAANVAGQVSAWNRESGRRIWRTDVEAWLSAGVGGGGEQVYVATAEGVLIALAATDGSERWRRDVNGELLAPPVATQGRVLLRTVDGRVLALDAGDGARQWTYSTDVPSLSLRGNSQPVPVQGGVLIGLDNGRLVALQDSSGRALWETTIQEPEGRSPIERMVDIDGAIGIGRNVIYAVTYQGRIAQVEPREGRIQWSREMSSYAGLTTEGQRIYVTDAASQVRALDPDTGATLWRQEKLAHRRLTAPVPIPGTEYLAMADYNGYVHILARADGRIVGRTRPGDSFGILADPVPTGEGRFVVQTQGGHLVSLQVAPLDD